MTTTPIGTDGQFNDLFAVLNLGRLRGFHGMRHRLGRLTEVYVIGSGGGEMAMQRGSGEGHGVKG